MPLLNRQNRMEQGVYACVRARICHVHCVRSQHWSLARAIYNIPGDTGCYISLHYSYRAFMLPSLRAHACVRVRRQSKSNVLIYVRTKNSTSSLFPFSKITAKNFLFDMPFLTLFFLIFFTYSRVNKIRCCPIVISFGQYLPLSNNCNKCIMIYMNDLCN